MPEQLAKPKTLPEVRNSAREILLLGIKNEYSPEDRKKLAKLISSATEFEYLFFLAEYHGVIPLLAYNISQAELKNLFPEEYQERLNRAFQNNVYRNIFISEELDRMLSVFSQHGIDTISIKGIILAEQLYANAMMRTTSDIDILLHEDKISSAVTLLQEMGYQELIENRKRKHAFHRVFFKDSSTFPLVIELHWNLKDPSVVAFHVSEIWNRSQEYQFRENNTRVLSPEDNFLYLAYSPLTQDGQLLKYLGDITLLLETHHDTLNWDLILELTTALGISPAVYYSLKWSRDLLGAQVPASAMERLKPALWKRWLINLFITNEDIFSPIKWNKLRTEILVFTRSLMLKRIKQSYIVLAKYRGYNKRFVWLRTLAGIPLTFTMALCLKIGKLLDQ